MSDQCHSGVAGVNICCVDYHAFRWLTAAVASGGRGGKGGKGGKKGDAKASNHPRNTLQTQIDLPDMAVVVGSLLTLIRWTTIWMPSWDAT